MRKPWFDLDPVEDEFFDMAPLTLREEFEIPLRADRVWGDLTCKGPLAWCRVLRGVTWTSPRPFGVGATRTARAVGGLVIRERFFCWEEGRRHAFFVEQANAPLFRRFAEDYRVEPAGAGACRFTWTIAIEPRPVARPAVYGGKLLLKTAFQDTARHYRSF